MARAGETPTAAFQGLAYGMNQQVNDASQLIDNTPPYDPTQDFNPANPSEQFLYGPTDRPNEPVTAGAPVGPGQNFVDTGYDSPEMFTKALATRIDQDPASSSEAKAFAARVARGL